jgi:tRNASer (uridine44-2'-O)-methyltransferase
MVIQDIGIATFLMLLWKDTYGPETIPPDPTPVAASNIPDAPASTHQDARPWHRWPRPPGGFVDLGCGNGLLTHILISEGYVGYGIDLRARTSWIHYPRSTQSHLLVHALDPTATAPTKVLSTATELQQQPHRHFRRPIAKPHSSDTIGNNEEDETESTSNTNDPNLDPPPPPNVLLPTGCFLIGNHADELTPWIPPLATRFLASGYLSIPCCAWSFDARFDRTRDIPFCAVDTESLNLGGGGEGAAGSSYSLYRVWLAALSMHCGWAVEVEMLRIPSTRNWAIVGEF